MATLLSYRGGAKALLADIQELGRAALSDVWINQDPAKTDTFWQSEVDAVVDAMLTVLINKANMNTWSREDFDEIRQTAREGLSR